MDLYDRLLYLHENPTTIAENFAEYLEFCEYGCPAEAMAKEFKAIIRARNEIVGNREIDLERSEGAESALEEFANVVFVEFGPSTDARRASWEAYRASWEAQHKKECEESRRRYEAEIKAIDTLFLALCRALKARGYRITPGQLSALKREKIPGHLCKRLDKLKRPKSALLHPEERLDKASAAALYAALTRTGLLEGSYATFIYYLGECTAQGGIVPENALKWLGTLSGFAYFARRFSEYTQAGAGRGHIVREKALCRAFGIDDRTRRNTIHPYLVDRKRPRAGFLIERAFDEAKEARERNKNRIN